MSLQTNVASSTGWHSLSAAHANAVIGIQTTGAMHPLQAGHLAEAPAARLHTTPVAPGVGIARQDVPINELRFRALETPAEIGAIKYLRDELSLPGSVLADPEFLTLEKKETSGAWLALSASVMHLSGRSASFQ
ncbi:hypothetical protein BH11PSE7_BH11PSE7_07110 [soil metagenome]